MIRRYLALSIVAMVAYSLVAPILKVAMEAIPSTTAVFMSNFVMLVLLGGLLVYDGTSARRYLSHEKAPLILAWGVALTVGLLTYYRALALGPVSIVVPIFGLFIVVSSIIGILAFQERLTLRKAAAITLAIVAIVLMAV